MRANADRPENHPTPPVQELLARPSGGGVHVTPDREKAGLRATTTPRTPPPQPSSRTSTSDLNDADALAVHAIDYARHHWLVFPLNGKIPAIAGGRGVLDATCDVDVVAAWWGGRYRNANIGGRVPESMVVLDIDPRHGGLTSLATLEDKHGRLPETLTTLSGRGDGGRHLFLRRPPGRLSSKRLGAGIDVKTSTGRRTRRSTRS